MHFAKTSVAALTAALLAATSASAAVVTKRDETWTLDGLHRDCAKDGSHCTWSFDIDNKAGEKAPCKHIVKSQGGKPASQSHGGPTFCGVYRLESSWDNSNGPDKAFSVIGVLDQSRKVIGFFGYDDAEVADGRVVTPDHTSVIKPFNQKSIL
ncbi:hypothetical protein HRG_005350 [Hirsutella rhossiliensis]|uniref:Small secreted protein n=1 Tax=Hirsutella rhossiliensis TaxID=111463 RepID=A0A9P8SIP5_9HYPO|nr:uncharacterized protein HRG_05350 [Hirsutella rhossiliensis]KAH0962840.1 hypothetical protein HRG_05350 [Hirsutella rhossiliensis]